MLLVVVVVMVMVAMMVIVSLSHKHKTMQHRIEGEMDRTERWKADKGRERETEEWKNEREQVSVDRFALHYLSLSQRDLLQLIGQ